MVLLAKMSLNKVQLHALEAVKLGQSIFLTGSPGTGKSFVLKHIIDYLKSINKDYAVTSSTGCSAILINGQTIHSYLGMGIGNTPVDKIVLGLMKNKMKYQKLCDLRTLILDEVSMINDSTLNNISAILQKIKSEKKPFGGVQMILVGDFCQLAPVSGSFCFTSESWNDLRPVCIQLKELIRQKDDHVFQDILQEVRFGKCCKKTFDILKKLNSTIFENITPTKLYSLNVDVQSINDCEYQKKYLKKNGIPVSKAKIIQCFPIVLDNDIDCDMQLLTIDNHNSDIDVYRYNALTNDKTIKTQDYTIDLFKGLQVMVTRNINFETGLINGTLGTIISISPSSVCIEDEKGKRHMIYYHTCTNENTKTYVKFMPIKMAYALSIHKSQGTTLDAVEIDGSTYIFASGQLYTALSRAKNLSSVKILNLDKNSFICDNLVKKFYENMVTDNDED